MLLKPIMNKTHFFAIGKKPAAAERLFPTMEELAKPRPSKAFKDTESVVTNVTFLP